MLFFFVRFSGASSAPAFRFNRSLLTFLLSLFAYCRCRWIVLFLFRLSGGVSRRRRGVPRQEVPGGSGVPLRARRRAGHDHQAESQGQRGERRRPSTSAVRLGCHNFLVGDAAWTGVCGCEMLCSAAVPQQEGQRIGVRSAVCGLLMVASWRSCSIHLCVLYVPPNPNPHPIPNLSCPNCLAAPAPPPI